MGVPGYKHVRWYGHSREGIGAARESAGVKMVCHTTCGFDARYPTWTIVGLRGVVIWDAIFRPLCSSSSLSFSFSFKFFFHYSESLKFSLTHPILFFFALYRYFGEVAAVFFAETLFAFLVGVVAVEPGLLLPFVGFEGIRTRDWKGFWAGCGRCRAFWR
tara:strand:- start:137 stop:616 length:480 start_codon:yes stop_codon:yes gene_type:complete